MYILKSFKPIMFLYMEGLWRYLFIVDQSNHRVQIFDPRSQQVLGAVGSKGLGPTHFDTPSGVVADRENRVVVSDLLNHRLQVLEFHPRSGSRPLR